MKRKPIYRFIFMILSISLVLSACSSSGSSTLTEDTKVTKKERTAFSDKVSSVCASIEVSEFPSLFDVLNDTVEEAALFKQQAQVAEDAIDGALSRFSDIEAPKAYEDDWDSMVEDFSAVRNAYPKLGEASERYADVASDLSIDSGAEEYKAADKELTEIEDNVDMVIRDLEQRYKAIKDASKKYNFDGCDLER